MQMLLRWSVWSLLAVVLCGGASRSVVVADDTVDPHGFIHLALDPTSPLATRNAHLTVREAGLQKTIALLMREYERGMREGLMTLSFQGYDEVDGRPAYHLAFVCHADSRSGYYAQRGA